jgi:quercetin dioxygenase-like cupin family protein
MTQISAQSPYVLQAGEGKPLAWFDSTITLKASSPELGATEVIIHPGEEPPMHVHKYEDEWFYLLEGEVTFHVGGESYLGRAGAFVSFPRSMPHTFTVESSSAHFMVMNTPGGFERMFEMAPTNDEEALRAMNAVGIEVVGPHPRYARAS